jgi:hypothetical protein
VFISSYWGMEVQRRGFRMVRPFIGTWGALPQLGRGGVARTVSQVGDGETAACNFQAYPCTQPIFHTQFWIKGNKELASPSFGGHVFTEQWLQHRPLHGGSHGVPSVNSPCLHTTETTIQLRGTGEHSFSYLPSNCNQHISFQRAGSVFWNYAQGICHQGIYGSKHTQTFLLEYVYFLSSENFIRPCYWGGWGGRDSPNYFCIPSIVVMWKRSRFLFGRNWLRNPIGLPAHRRDFSQLRSGQTGHNHSF